MALTQTKLLEIGAAFDSFKETGGPPKADPDVYVPVIEHLKLVNIQSTKVIDKPIINTITPNADQWNDIINYYYYIHDNVDKDNLDIPMLADLEIWFIKFIEPRPKRSKNMGFKMDLWKDRELSKYKLMVSDYCPTAYRLSISEHNIESLALDKDLIRDRIKRVEELYRTTPQTIVIKAKDGTVTRSMTNKDGNVVNINKILGR